MVKLLRCNGALPRVRHRRGLDGRPLYPEVRPLSTATTHAEAHPSSSKVLLFHPTRPSRPWYGTMQGTRCPAHTMRGPVPVPQSRSSRGPRCVRVCVCARERASG